jgi:hypothetical protein
VMDQKENHLKLHYKYLLAINCHLKILYSIRHIVNMEKMWLFMLIQKMKLKYDWLRWNLSLFVFFKCRVNGNCYPKLKQKKSKVVMKKKNARKKLQLNEK